MGTCSVPGKLCIALSSAQPPVNVQVHPGEGKGSSITTTQYQNTNSSILESLIKLLFSYKRLHVILLCPWESYQLLCPVHTHQ